MPDDLSDFLRDLDAAEHPPGSNPFHFLPRSETAEPFKLPYKLESRPTHNGDDRVKTLVAFGWAVGLFLLVLPFLALIASIQSPKNGTADEPRKPGPVWSRGPYPYNESGDPSKGFDERWYHETKFKKLDRDKFIAR